MTPENTYRYECKACRKIDDQKRYQRDKERKAANNRQLRLDALAYRALTANKKPAAKK